MPLAGELLDDAERRLKRSPYIEHPHAGKERFDAEELLEFVLGELPYEDDEVSAAQARRFHRLLDRRVSGVPGAYLTGRTEFKGMMLYVTRGAFIPRESSEDLADGAIQRLRGRRDPVHLDAATGVGPVALAVARSVRKASVYGVDISAKPVELARKSAKALGLRNATFLRGDLFAPLPKGLLGRVDVITVHPPYVPKSELRDLPHEIRAHEPKESLTDFSEAGTGLLTRVATEGHGWLAEGGWLLVEVSPDRAREVGTVLRRQGYSDVRSTKGEIAVSRIVVGRHRGT
ncbi:MAG TPA: HemK/PrmC family methyltransferase [Actinomycetota bacterium]